MFVDGSNPSQQNAGLQLAALIEQIYQSTHTDDNGVAIPEQEDRCHVGWLLGIQQEQAQPFASLLAPDHFLLRAGGVPLHSLLLAVPPKESQVLDTDTRLIRCPGVLLIRPVGTLSEMQRSAAETLLQYYRNDPTPGAIRQTGTDSKGLDSYTKHMHSFGGFRCQVLGTLYSVSDPTPGQPGKLKFDPDLEYAPSDCNYTVIKPSNLMTSRILREIRKQSDHDGIRIGRIQYSATQNIQQSPHLCAGAQDIPAEMAMDEILARRTALFGMTRTGKSNTVKIIATNIALRNPHVGQLIFDINGEYANPNREDNGSLSLALGYTGKVKVLSSLNRPKAGVGSFLPNFYLDLTLGHGLIMRSLDNTPSAEAFATFSKMSFIDDPDVVADKGFDLEEEFLKVLLYRALLCNSGYPGMKAGEIFGLSWEGWQTALGDAGVAASTWGQIRSDIGACKSPADLTAIGGKWMRDHRPDVSALGQLLAGESTKNKGPIAGKGFLRAGLSMHSASGPKLGLVRDLVESLDQGELVIMDLSLSKPSSQHEIMAYIASNLFVEASKRFVSSLDSERADRKCLWMVYIEEAHNMIGRGAKPDDPWPRMAKEGGKMGIGMVYATQEPSSVQTNIMSNTENMIVSHLNNTREAHEVGCYNDFETFYGSILRIRTPGYVRVRQRDLPFTMPVQVDEFTSAWVENLRMVIGEPDQTREVNAGRADPTPQEIPSLQAPQTIQEDAATQTMQAGTPLASARRRPTAGRWGDKGAG